MSAAGNDEMARVHWDVAERSRIVRRLDFTRADRIDAVRLLLEAHIEQSKAKVRKITLHTLHAARERAAR